MSEPRPPESHLPHSVVQPLWLEENVLLRAGAGTGKTHALVTLALGSLAGLRRKPSVPAERLWLLTFTEKAAAELRGRLRARLRALATGASGVLDEPELVAAAEAIGKPFPPAERWQLLGESLEHCHATTLHGACASLLRELPSAGSRSFEVWDERRAAETLRKAAREAVLEGSGADELLEDLSFSGTGFNLGLVEMLCAVQGRLAEDGLSAQRLSSSSIQRPQDELAAAQLAAAAQLWRERFTALVQLAPPCAGIDACARALDAWPREIGFASIEGVWDLLATASDSFQLRSGRGQEERKAARAAHDGLKAAWVEARTAQHGEVFHRLLDRTQTLYRDAKAAAHALDFADLCNQTRDRLRDDRSARHFAKERVGILLLDEAQDTNRVQLEICLLLCERRDREAVLTAEVPLEEAIELEPGTFCAVGDRKQSIYEFRGADVAVFERMAASLSRGGGQERLLSHCRRSRPELVDQFNALFGKMMRGGDAEYELAFDPTRDRLEALREPAGIPAIELLSVGGDSAAESRRREARELARKAAELLRVPPPSVVRALGGPLQPGHIALLFRRSAHIGLFRAAFAEERLPCAVVGEGFYESQEILDVSAALNACLDPDDGNAVLTLLRSPLCGLSDEGVLRLALRKPSGLSLRDESLRASVPGLTGDDADRWNQFGARFPELRASAESLGPAALLERLEVHFDLRARYGETQAYANLDKLQRLLESWQEEGLGLASTSRRLSTSCTAPLGERPGVAVDELDLSAVRMMTIHQAKGLEFPVVMVPECGAVPQRDQSPVLYARQAGLALKARLPDGGWSRPTAYEAVRKERERRASADSLRLLYVAATRARELLFFSGEPPRNGGKGSWRSLLENAGLVAQACDADPDSKPAETPRAATEVVASAARGDSALLPLRLSAPGKLLLAATEAADLSLCLRRYQLRQLWNLPERVGHRPLPDELPEEENPRQLGSVAHQILERMDWPTALEDPDRAIRQAVARASAVRVESAVVSEIRAVLCSDLGRRIGALPAARVRREVPFVLRWGAQPALVLRGSIDLLLLLEDQALVIDYKRGPPGAPESQAAYRAQVEIYALAASRLLGGHLPIQGGLWFLGEAIRGPRLWSISSQRLDELRAGLSAQALAAVSAKPALEELWEGREISHCRSIQCLYISRCHRDAAPVRSGWFGRGSRVRKSSP